jgi:hypothetical protein
VGRPDETDADYPNVYFFHDSLLPTVCLGY